MTSAERHNLIELYRSGPSLVEQCLAAVPAESLDYSPGPQRWSIRQIVLHIVDSDISSFMRLRKPVAEPGTQVPVYDEEKWARALHGDDMSLETALALFRAHRTYNCEFLGAVTDDEWKQEVDHPERGSMSLDDVLNLYARHPTWHIDHIKRTLDTWQRHQAGEEIDPDISLWVAP